MKRWILANVFNTIIILVIIAAILTGCAAAGEDNDNPSTVNPPEMPPETSFVIDFNDFPQSNTPVKLDINVPGDQLNWGHAAVNVAPWNLTGVLGMDVPAAAFLASLKQIAVLQPDDSWLWNYNFTVQDTTYRAKLSGKYNTNNTVSWKMCITKEYEYLDFLWYYGESNLGATDGYWILKEKPANPFDLLRIDWYWNSTTGTMNTRYANIVPGGDDNGKYIYFTMRPGETYDCSYEIYNYQRAGDRIDVEWSSTTRAGRVRDLSRFGELNWHYWDSNLKDAAGS